MRRELRVGMAIGGVLLAVVVVYGIVAGHAKKHSTPIAAATDKAAPAPEKGTDGRPDDAASPTPAPPAPSTDDKPAPSPDATASAAGAEKSEASAGKGAVWDKLYSSNVPESSIPALLSTTPDPALPDSFRSAPAASGVAVSDTHAIKPGPDSAPASAAQRVATPSSGSGGSDAAPEHSAHARTHTVQKGETFSSIARTVYGNKRYYQNILKANPQLNANKLRPGTVINLPDIADAGSASDAGKTGTATPLAASTTTDKPTASADSTHEYTVKSGDSLYKIAIKLYGRGDKSTALYDANKTLIGPDPAKLKLGMVLKLPETPTATASR